ncbi:hypothetical protein YC2023_074214 [Brassica napus]
MGSFLYQKGNTIQATFFRDLDASTEMPLEETHCYEIKNCILTTPSESLRLTKKRYHIKLNKTSIIAMIDPFLKSNYYCFPKFDNLYRGFYHPKFSIDILVSASGAGLAISLVSEGLKVKPAHALSTAAVFAVVSGTIYKVSETIKSHNAQDAFYTETRVMLSKLGLEEYEKNFKKGHLTDPTLPFLTDRLHIHLLQA